MGHVGHVLWLLFGPGAWGTGGNIVAAVILGVPALWQVLRRIRASRTVTNAHVSAHMDALRTDLAAALQHIHGLDDDHPALTALRPSGDPDPKGM